MEAFDFAQTPRARLILTGQHVPDHYPVVLKKLSTTSSQQAVPQNANAALPIWLGTAPVIMAVVTGALLLRRSQRIPLQSFLK